MKPLPPKERKPRLQANLPPPWKPNPRVLASPKLKKRQCRTKAPLNNDHRNMHCNGGPMAPFLFGSSACRRILQLCFNGKARSFAGRNSDGGSLRFFSRILLCTAYVRGVRAGQSPVVWFGRRIQEKASARSVFASMPAASLQAFGASGSSGVASCPRCDLSRLPEYFRHFTLKMFYLMC